MMMMMRDDDDVRVNWWVMSLGWSQGSEQTIERTVIEPSSYSCLRGHGRHGRSDERLRWPLDSSPVLLGGARGEHPCRRRRGG